MKIVHLKRGTSPLLISIPHGGTALPEEIAERLNAEGRLLRDTDWHLGRLYDFLDDMDVTVIEAITSRYVIDLNRPPDARPFYPGGNETALCPSTTFDGAEIYRPGGAPDPQEVAHRLEAYWKPYHQALTGELARIKSEHGFALLLDAHSIRSHIPNLFEATLPDFNIGTNDGRSCTTALSDRTMAYLARSPNYSKVLNGRFKGGYISRHYGAPERDVHAIQLELSQACYMTSEPPFTYEEDKAASIRNVLQDFIRILSTFNPEIRKP